MSDGGTVFTVKFACDNCGKQWSLEFHEKVRVYRVSSQSSCIMTDDPREKYDPSKAPIESAIHCPNCKTYQDVKIVQRIPIEERSTID